jgi:hypothetical protein
MRVKASLILGAVLFMCLVGWTGYSQKSQAPKMTWEYLVVTDPTLPGVSKSFEAGVEKLNELGAQGWELAGVSNENVSAHQTHTKLFFRRAK